VARLPAIVLGASLASGATCTLTTGELLILLGVVALFIRPLAKVECRRQK
jgi:hypothetical protein